MTDSGDALELRFDGPAGARDTLVLAHGAGAPLDSPFLETVTQGLAEAGVRVVRFEFPYMRARRRGARRPPDRTPRLEACWREVVEALGGGEDLVLGGKSLGGRMAAHVADGVGARGLVVFGYPFHPPGRPERTRTGVLETIRTPTLILQGERDPFGRPEEVAGYRLSPAVRIVWIEDGDHSLRPRRRSGRSEAENLAAAVAHTLAFLEALRAAPGSSSGSGT